MGKFHIRLVGGWCGNRMVMVRDQLDNLLTQKGYDVKIDQQSVWESYAPPQHANLVLQLMPAFSPDELKPPSLLVHPFLKDLDHQQTLDQVCDAVAQYYPESSQPAKAESAQAG
jgi:galactitol-specific phosphotransferase system IIB component